MSDADGVVHGGCGVAGDVYGRVIGRGNDEGVGWGTVLGCELEVGAWDQYMIIEV